MSYYVPRGGHPGQHDLTTDRAAFTEAYAVLPRGTMRDIVVSRFPHWRETRGSVRLGVALATIGVTVSVGVVAVGAHYLLGLPWEQITGDYDVTRGGYMALGLLFMAATPRLAAWLRGSPCGSF